MRTFLFCGSLALGLACSTLPSSTALAQTADVALEVEVQPQPVVQPAPVQAQPYPAQPQTQHQARAVPVAPMQPLPVQQVSRPPESQERRRNSVFVEGLGAGLLYSINYERLLIEDLALRVGFGAYTLSSIFGGGRIFVATVPVSVSYLGLGSARHMFEVGAGATLIIAGDATSGIFSSGGSGAGVYGTVFAGYRMHPTGRAGFLFRAGIMGLFARGLSIADDATEDDFGILPWPYIGGGMSF